MSTNLSTPNGHHDSPMGAAGQAARRVGDVAAQQAGRVGEALHDWWSERRHGARHTLDEVRDRALMAGEHTREVVRERPMTSLLGAAAIGVALTCALLWLTRQSRN